MFDLVFDLEYVLLLKTFGVSIIGQLLVKAVIPRVQLDFALEKIDALMLRL